MPELPEVEAWRRRSTPTSSAARSRRPGPAHIATLKTFDPPLAALEGERVRRRAPAREAAAVPDRRRRARADGAPDERRAGSATSRPGEKSPKTPEFRLRFADGGELVLTEGGRKKRAGVWLMRPDAVEAELAHLGPEADTLTPETLAPILAADCRRLHSLLRDQRAIAGIGRAWANEILNVGAPLAVRALDASSTPRRPSGSPMRSAASSRAASSCGSRARRTRPSTASTTASASRARTAGTPLARVDFEEHTIYYCPHCQTGDRVLKDRRMSRLLR